MLVILWLPVLLAVVSLVVNLGNLLVDRARLQASADLAALAAVQSVDWDAMAEGDVRLVEELADLEARDYSMANVQSLMDVDPEEIFVWIVNASTDDPTPHPVTGGTLEHPTVILRLRAPGPGGLLTAAFGGVSMEAEADASIRPRE